VIIVAKPTIAIMYDFDKTLCTTDMQEYDFIKNLGITPSEFWGETSKLTKKNEMDKILAYMYVMIKMCKDKRISLTKDYLNNCGKNVVLYKGVSTWFDRIEKYANEIGVNVEHYIISSGITEIIEGTSIAKYFKHIYGCKFVYNEFGEAIWPGLAINFTLKTQYIFRIAKGVLDVRDDVNLNNHTNNKKIPFENMIYIGDGLTDVPCMKLLKDKGGKSIALYPSINQRQQALKLVEDERINYVCVADYREKSTLEKIVKLMLDNVKTMTELKEREQKQIQAFKKASEA
jgi:2-hydroxy-3-keto-5-methylthiopentenyl-1-phosphate phosphatase